MDLIWDDIYLHGETKYCFIRAMMLRGKVRGEIRNLDRLWKGGMLAGSVRTGPNEVIMGLVFANNIRGQAPLSRQIRWACPSRPLLKMIYRWASWRALVRGVKNCLHPPLSACHVCSRILIAHVQLSTTRKTRWSNPPHVKKEPGEINFGIPPIPASVLISFYPPLYLYVKYSETVPPPHTHIHFFLRA